MMGATRRTRLRRSRELRPRPRLTRVATRLFLASLLTGALFVGSSMTAQAATAYLNGTHAGNAVMQWWEPRTNSNARNLMSTQILSVGGGASLSLGVRNMSGVQIARAEGGPSSSWRPFVKPNGSSAIPGGTFYMNSKFLSNSSSVYSWSANLSYSNFTAAPL
jgi:hypothetical protein